MIKFFDIYKQDKKLFSKFLSDFTKTIKKTNFINGDPVLDFEKILEILRH